MRYFNLKHNTNNKHCWKVIDYEKAFNVLEFLGDFPPKIDVELKGYFDLKHILQNTLFYICLIMNVILSSDSFNCVAFAADCKYKWIVVDLFILFCSCFNEKNSGKNTTTLSTKQELSPEHHLKFVWLKGIVFFGMGSLNNMHVNFIALW